VTGVFGVAGAIGTVVAFIKVGATTANLYIAAIIAVVTTWLIISAFYYENCLDSPRTFPACSAGVIEATVAAFTSLADQLFAFAASHDRIDVVVKSVYWDLVGKNAPYVNCSPNDNSPMLSGFYHNDAVCAAGLGGSIGAAVGGVLGVFLGALAGGAIASLACGIWVWVCAIAALVVAMIIAAVCAIVGAVLGSAAGRWTAESGRALPIDPNAPDVSYPALTVGDYVTTKGNLISDSDANGMYVYWFVTDTTLHGRSTSTTPFSSQDPDTNLPVDACPPPEPPIG